MVTSSEAKKKVLIAIPSGGDMMPEFVGCYGSLVAECCRRGGKDFHFEGVIVPRNEITSTRNLLSDASINDKYDLLFMIDDDMTFERDIFFRLVAHDKDIISPLIFMRRAPYWPSIFYEPTVKVRDMYYRPATELLYRKPGLYEVDAVGAACMLVKTSVFKKITKPFFWMGQDYGEDMFFCNKAKHEAKASIFVDTSIEAPHLGERMKIDSKLWSSTYLPEDKIDESKRVAVIIPTYNNRDMLVRCIDSLNTFTDYDNFHIVVVNNGERDLDLPLDRWGFRLNELSMSENLGWVGGVNRGIEFCRNTSAAYYLLMNDDVEITPDSRWLHKMLSSFHDGVGAVGPLSDFVIWVQMATVRGLPIRHYTNLLSGFCLLMKREVVEKVGGLDSRFGLGGNDDLDYSIRMRKAGYKLVVARDVFIKHRGQVTQRKVFPDVKAEDAKTHKMLIDKWGEDEVNQLFSEEVLKDARA